MLANLLKRTIRRSFDLIGLKLTRKDSLSPGCKYPRGSLLGLLEQARNAGLRPASIIDVGAALGSFTVQCQNVFPDSTYLLVEALEEYKPLLDEVTRSAERTKYVLAAAASRPGVTTIYVHPDLVGSTLYHEEEGTDGDAVPRNIPAVMLDSLVEREEMKPPFLVKIDVQGAELEVLAGAENVLDGTEYALIEVSLFQFFEGGPQVFDVLSYMKSKGFVMHDICTLQYRPLDNALSQIDVAFVREHGVLRKDNRYGTTRQIEEYYEKATKQIRKVLKESF
jgi:FkbM family methyltransferase